ncbi:MAG: phosphodiester glycosidase family protein [Pseudomonadales bacterium]|nr:phosphodiester glycosidase family protein [Candidatus Woesebacteria bacterium]MCB9801628.1 phosphodiester glycosidase family protein [Pseudomonadales bacterium]
MKKILLIVLVCSCVVGWWLVVPHSGESSDLQSNASSSLKQLITGGPSPSPTLSLDAWTSLDAGLDLQHISYQVGSRTSYIEVYKLDTSILKPTLLFDQQGKFISEWQQDNALVINAGFFKEDNEPVGLFYIDGTRLDSHRIVPEGTGLVVLNNAALTIRNLTTHPPTTSESFDTVLQSYPLLISDGEIVLSDNTTDKTARRTAIGTDAVGNVYLFLANEPNISLSELTKAIHESDIEVVEVLNLDGGGSSGISINLPEYTEQIDSLTPVPTVLLFE